MDSDAVFDALEPNAFSNSSSKTQSSHPSLQSEELAQLNPMEECRAWHVSMARLESTRKRTTPVSGFVHYFPVNLIIESFYFDMILIVF